MFFEYVSDQEMHSKNKQINFIFKGYDMFEFS